MRTIVSSALAATFLPLPRHGSTAPWARIEAAAIPAEIQNAARQVLTCPISAEAGSAATVAMKMPPLTIASALPRASSSTSEIAAPDPKTQKPPMATPSKPRDTSITPKFGVKAATTFETSIKSPRARRSARRSIAAELRVSSGAATAAVTAGTTIVSPPTPIETWRE